MGILGDIAVSLCHGLVNSVNKASDYYDKKMDEYSRNIDNYNRIADKAERDFMRDPSDRNLERMVNTRNQASRISDAVENYNRMKYRDDDDNYY